MQDRQDETLDSSARRSDKATAGDPPPERRRAHDEPEHIGPYRMLERMGEGGMGVVYKAEQREPVRRVVALKVIKLGMDTREVVARFEAERQALAMMSHPNVAKVFEAGMTEQGRPYFAMEFVPGVPLTSYCDDNRLTTRERLELFIQVCHAVQHAHQKGIIHRDLKPTNILVSMFDGRPVPKVIDFGIAKAANQALTQKTLFTQTGALIGTPEYMSPEQAQTSGLDVDTRTDVYSLGVILYELLTGKLPFDAETLRRAGMDGMARIIKETEPAKPSTRLTMIDAGGDSKGTAETPFDEAARKRRSDSRTLRRELRGDLDWITLKAMEKDRTRRYETANGLALDVQRYLDDEPIAARPPSTVYRLGKVVHRHKVVVAAAALVVVALLLGVVGTTLGMMRARAATARAVAAERVAVEQRQIAEGQRTVAMQNEAVADNNAAHVFLVKGDFTAAEPLLVRTLEIRRQLRGPEHAEVADALAELARLRQAKGDAKAAERTYREALAMEIRLNGERHGRVAHVYEKLGALYMSAGRNDDAEANLRQSLQIYRTSAEAPDAEGIASALGDLGMLLYRKGDAAAAEPLLRESLEDWKRVPGYEAIMHYDVTAIAQALSKLHEARGDKRGAAPYVRQYLLIQIAHISMGIAANPNDSSFLRARSQMYAEVGQFPQMLADTDRLIRVTPNDHLLYMVAACAHLFLGEDAAYRQLCRQMYDRYAKVNDARVRDRVAKTCLAGPGALSDLAPVIAMARANISPEVTDKLPGAKDVVPLFHLCAAMAEYRAGGGQAVLDDLDEPTVGRLSIEPRATAACYRAMALRRMGKRDDAAAELKRAREMFQHIASPDAEYVEVDATLQDWFIAQSAMREAEGVVGKD